MNDNIDVSGYNYHIVHDLFLRSQLIRSLEWKTGKVLYTNHKEFDWKTGKMFDTTEKIFWLFKVTEESDDNYWYQRCWLTSDPGEFSTRSSCCKIGQLFPQISPVSLGLHLRSNRQQESASVCMVDDKICISMYIVCKNTKQSLQWQKH